MRAACFALVALLTLWAGAARAVSDPGEMLPDRARELRAEAIGQQLRCLVCQNESVEESDAELARDLRRIIRQRVAAGDDDKAVIAWMTARYGDFVRLRPPFRPRTKRAGTPPGAGGAPGGGAPSLGGRPRAAPPAPLSEAERARLAKLVRTP